MSPLEQEHRKRVWWTTICMDVTTCIELSLEPACVFKEDSIGFPDSSQLSMEDAEEFSDPQYLTAQVKLCRIKYQIIKTVSELRFGNAVEAQALIGPCLQALNRWSLEFSPRLEFTEQGGFLDNTLAFSPMRTVASLLLRYNQVRRAIPDRQWGTDGLVFHPSPSPVFVETTTYPRPWTRRFHDL